MANYTIKANKKDYTMLFNGIKISTTKGYQEILNFFNDYIINSLSTKYLEKKCIKTNTYILNINKIIDNGEDVFYIYGKRFYTKEEIIQDMFNLLNNSVNETLVNQIEIEESKEYESINITILFNDIEYSYTLYNY